jgi:hypothetical protein
MVLLIGPTCAVNLSQSGTVPKKNLPRFFNE